MGEVCDHPVSDDVSGAHLGLHVLEGLAGLAGGLRGADQVGSLDPELGDLEQQGLQLLDDLGDEGSRLFCLPPQRGGICC